VRRHRHEDHEEHVNHEAWVIPYADLLTLLMGLFIVLWSISNTDLRKLKEVQSSLIKGFGGKPPAEVQAEAPAGPNSEPSPGTTVVNPAHDPAEVAKAFEALDAQQAAEAAKAASASQLDQVEQALSSYVNGAGLGGAVSFHREDRGLVVTVVTDQVLFDPGSSDLRPEGRALLDVLAPGLRSVENPIAIEGHTDSRPIDTARFPSNWELSTGRAATVLRYLVDTHGFAPSRISAAGFGDQRPIGDNATDAGRAANRRVELVVLPLPSG
jgi:chemotaxis protein MotB